MGLRQRLALGIIRRSFHLSVWTIGKFCDIEVYEAKARELQELPAGSLGKAIGDCLEQHRLRMVPNFESHDLKHVLLNFKMILLDEIRLQAFMLGNGNYSPASFAIFIFGATLLPSCWRIFQQDFRNGRSARPVSAWTIEDYKHCQTDTLRELVFNYVPTPKSNVGNLVAVSVFGAFAAMLIGIAAMVYCLPFLFSENTTDLIGAGFPFLAAALSRQPA